LILGYQLDEQISLSFFAGLVFLQLIFIIRNRPYKHLVHMVGITVNQLSLLVLAVCLIWRNNSIKNGINYSESDNFMTIILIIFTLVIVLICAMTRLISLIVKKCRKLRETVVNSRKYSIEDMMLNKSSLNKNTPFYGNSILRGNKYFIDNQIAKVKHK
jgi:hypothetical protein